MKEIQLSQSWFCKNKGKYVALVDDEDYDSLNQFRWNVHKDGNSLYATRNIIVDGNRRLKSMHGQIMNGKWIDHIDHDGLNNQKSNLRFCSLSENLRNARKHNNCSSTYKGVNFHKLNKNWTARIQINGKQIYLGSFASEIDAAKAYNAKAIELFLEFANLNIIS